MKLKHLLFAVISLFMLFQSCSDDDTNIVPEEKIPETVQKDIDTRFANSVITYHSVDSTGLLRIQLVDENSNKAELLYKDNLLDAEYRTIAELDSLPQKVRTTFDSLSIQGISDFKIYRTQRSYLKHDLYTFCFLQTTDKVTNLQYSIFINDDGTLLYKINRTTNDNVMLFANYKTELSEVDKNYPNANVRCQLNDGGFFVLIIIQDNYTKFVSFDRNNNTNTVIWKETRYELPSNFDVPASVLAKLKKVDAQFTYTSITRIETPSGNSYMFTDGTREDKLGYGIPE